MADSRGGAEVNRGDFYLLCGWTNQDRRTFWEVVMEVCSTLWGLKRTRRTFLSTEPPIFSPRNPPLDLITARRYQSLPSCQQGQEEYSEILEYRMSDAIRVIRY